MVLRSCLGIVQVLVSFCEKTLPSLLTFTLLFTDILWLGLMLQRISLSEELQRHLTQFVYSCLLVYYSYLQARGHEAHHTVPRKYVNFSNRELTVQERVLWQIEALQKNEKKKQKTYNKFAFPIIENEHSIMPTLKLKYPTNIRWLAMESAIKVIHRCYGSIMAYTESNKGKNTK